MGYADKNDVKILRPLILPDISYDILYQAFLAAYDYDIKARTEKVGTHVVIMLGGDEPYAKNSIPLVQDKCINLPDIYEIPDKAHAEVLSKEPIIISDLIQRLLVKEK